MILKRILIILGLCIPLVVLGCSRRSAVHPKIISRALSVQKSVPHVYFTVYADALRITGQVFAVTPSGAYVYSANCSDPSGHSTIEQFRQAKDGHLTPIAKPIDIYELIGNLIVEPHGHFLYVPMQDGDIGLYRIQTTGVLQFDDILRVPGTFDIARLDDGQEVDAGPFSDGTLGFDKFRRRAHLFHEDGGVGHTESIRVEYKILRNGHFREIGRYMTLHPNDGNPNVFPVYR